VRRAFGRGRFLVVVGSLTALVGMVPAWWVIERTGLPSLTGNGFEGAGLVVFLCCLAILAVIVLPFASRDGDSALDRGPVYMFLLIAAAGAYLWRIYEIVQFGGLVPAQTIGLWVTGAGLLITAWGVGDIFTERSTSIY
jgi:cation transport ATPase